MAVISLDVDKKSVGVILSAMDRIRAVASGGVMGMMPAAGAMLENQHHRRVASEKRTSGGTPWKPNIRGTSILYMSGALAGGFRAQSSIFMTRLGPPGLPYAYIHEAGGTMHGSPYMIFKVGSQFIYATKSEVPSRSYMGISPENWIELQQLINRFISRGFGWLS